MTNLKKVISLFLALCLLTTAFPVRASAQEPQTEEEPMYFEDWYTSEADADPNALYEGYISQLFYGGISLYGTAAGNKLTGDNRLLYDALGPFMREIANGQRASSSITVGQDVLYQGTQHKADAKVTFTGKDITKQQISLVISALLSDYPYECYWYDKSIGCEFSWFISSKSLLQVTFKFTVATDYRGADKYTANTAKTSIPKQSLDRAKFIVSKYASESDYHKLVAYKDEICSLVSYDFDAAENLNTTDGINPWQMISVFDGDVNTNVVCEGYSKAFLYLCDLTDFAQDITCYTVSGYINGGPHMWNIVDINGNHYMADVTNSDSGTVGQHGGLFLDGASGSISEGYTAAGCFFTYNTSALSLWGSGSDSILNLSATPYSPDAHVIVIQKAVAPTCTQPGKTEGQYCSVCGTVLVAQKTINATGHKIVAIPGKAATCTEPGLSDGKICSTCHTVTQKQEVIPAKGHTAQVVPGKAATCKETGLTEGKSCSVCKAVITAQEVIPVKAHKEETIPGKAATCKETGLTKGRKCTVCGTITLEQEIIPYLAHTEETIPGKAATCTETGLTDGKKCTVCDTVTVKQETIPAEHRYGSDEDADCDVCGQIRDEKIPSVPMYRMYDPNSGEHFYSGSELERDFLVAAGWHYEGVGFNFPAEGDPVHRLYDPVYGEHLYTMDTKEMNKLLARGWNYEGVAFNSAGKDAVPQYRLHNPNAKRGGYHFTGSEVERDILISAGWIPQGIGWYSCLE